MRTYHLRAIMTRERIILPSFTLPLEDHLGILAFQVYEYTVRWISASSSLAETVRLAAVLPECPHTLLKFVTTSIDRLQPGCSATSRPGMRDDLVAEMEANGIVSRNRVVPGR